MGSACLREHVLPRHPGQSPAFSPARLGPCQAGCLRLTPPHALVQQWDLSPCHLLPILPGPGDKANLPWKVRRSTGKTNTSAVPLSPCSQPSHLTFLYSRVNDLVPTSHKVPKGMKVGCCGRSQRRKWPSWTWCHRISNLILSRAKENWRRGQGVKGSGSWADWSGQSVWERQPSLNW